jgi:hypothetical protein
VATMPNPSIQRIGPKSGLPLIYLFGNIETGSSTTPIGGINELIFPCG